MPLVQHTHMVQTLAAERADHRSATAFGLAAWIGASDSGHADALGALKARLVLSLEPQCN